MKKFFTKLVFTIIIILIIVVGYFYFIGKSLYNTKIGEKSISIKIEEIKKYKNYTTLDKVPKDYINAIIAVEDHRFYEHGAVDYLALVRAGAKNFKSKSLIEGGSTITQQVAKNLYFITDGDGIDRKVAELMIAEELEKQFSKDEILELYINIIYFGDGYYCVYDACMGYFNKKPIDMNLYESTLLAGIPNAPSIYAPTANIELSKKRQQKVINDMIKYNYLTKEQAEKIVNYNLITK